MNNTVYWHFYYQTLVRMVTKKFKEMYNSVLWTFIFEALLILVWKLSVHYIINLIKEGSITELEILPFKCDLASTRLWHCYPFNKVE